jgi:hypothetical protein
LYFSKNYVWLETVFCSMARMEAVSPIQAYAANRMGRLSLPILYDPGISQLHCSMSVRRQMSARASTAAAWRLYRAKK